MTSLRNKIHASLAKDASDSTMKQWCAYIQENKTDILTLLPLIHAGHPVGMRFSWLLGGLCETAPEIARPAIPYFFNHRQEIRIQGFNRSLAKMFFHCGIPEEMEGEATDALFRWLLDPASNVSTKRIALLALFTITRKYPALTSELRLTIEELNGKHTPAFDKLLHKILGQLG